MEEMQSGSTALSQSATPTKQSNSTFLAATLALLIAIILTVAGLVCARSIMGTLKSLNTSNQVLHQQVQQLQGIQATTLDRLNQQHQQLVKSQQFVAGNQKPWVISEANYLVRLASYNLSYGRDVNTAIALLQTADQRVAQLNDPTLNSLRQQLANAIAALQPATKIDLVGILARISALQLQVKQLPLITPPTFTVAKSVAKPAAQPQSVWRTALENSLATLKSLVIIRHHQQPIEPLLDAEQLHYLQQNLQLQLQQAQWAVLHGQQKVYQTSLQQALTWVQDYFASSSPQTTAFIQELQQLQKVNIQPDLPDLTALLNALAQAEQPATNK